MTTITITSERQLTQLLKTPPSKKTWCVVESRHGGGLALVLRPDRKPSWVYRFRLGSGPLTEYRIGTHPALTLSDAKAAHAEAVELVRKGIDPRHVRTEQKAANLEMPTLAKLFDDWLAFKVATKAIKPRTVADYQGTYDRHLVKLGKVRVADLTRAVLAGHLEQVRKVSAEGVRKGLIVLNLCLDRAVMLGHIELNPARLLKPKAFEASMGKPRQRWLTIDEIKDLWRALDVATTGGGAVAAGGLGVASTAVLSRSVANALRLVMLTAARRDEVAGMRWQDVDGDRWTVPETKNGKAHVITLSPLALSILKEQQALGMGGAFVFASYVTGKAIDGQTIWKALDRVRKKHLAELEPFCVHDLRRSVATGCAEYLDAPERLIELLLNHVHQERLVRTYQVSSHAEKLRELFLRWGAFIEKKTSPDGGQPSNVVAVQFGGKAKPC